MPRHPLPLLFAFVLCLLVPATAASTPIKVAVISDINSRYGSTEYHQRVAAAVAHIVTLAPDVVISTGDMVAGQRPDPLLTAAELDALWQAFHSAVHAPLIAAGIPLVMAPGNHDASAFPPFALEREAYARYYRAHPPAHPVAAGGNPPFHFRSDIGALRLLVLDATRPGPLPAAQRDWLATELADNPASHTLVMGHLPLQPIAIGREQDIIEDPALEQLLAQAGITAYLSGHHHAYYPGQRENITMLSVGNLGGNQRPLVGTTQRTGFSFLWLELQPEGSFTAQAMLAPAFQDAVAIDSLPATLGEGSNTLTRLDVLGSSTRCTAAALTAPEGCRLSDGRISFQLQATNNGSLNTLTLTPAGLSIDNRASEHEIDGTVYGAELADLDGNGWPEVYVYASSAGSGSYGSLVAFAVNNGKSATPIYLPPLDQTPELASGYRGHDQFQVQGDRLLRHFPLYREGDVNAAPTGGQRTLRYRLAAGEAGWQLVPDRASDR